MDYPSWSPRVLVAIHQQHLKEPVIWLSADEKIERLRSDPRCAHFEEADWERLTLNFHRVPFLPDKEATELLGKLLTDQQMRGAWLSLDKRFTKDFDYHAFWWTCQQAIMGWRGAQKLTRKERKQFFLDLIHNLKQTREMLADAEEFDSYTITDLIDEKRIDQLIELLPVEPDPQHHNTQDGLRRYVRFTLDDVIPHIQVILRDLENKATHELGVGQHAMIKKPNSPNAPVHYFARRVSSFFRERYGQPLHEVVAATASVVFDRIGLDSDYVRKIVKEEGG